MYLLAVDGGSSKTDFCLFDESGHVHGRVVLTGSNIMHVGQKGLHQIIEEGLHGASKMAGVNPEDISAACIGLAGYDEAENSKRDIEATVYKLLPPSVAMCTGDMDIAWAGALGLQPGINVVAGTGSVAYGRDTRGNTGRAGGWSCPFLDEGSAHWTARKTMELFTKQADGRLPKSLLYDKVRAAFSLQTDNGFFDVVAQVLAQKQESTARLQLALRDALFSGDEQARKVYEQGAGELAALVRTLQKRLQFPKDKQVLVSCTGGMFKNPQYFSMLCEALAEDTCDFKHPVAQPVAGAALLAMEKAGRPIAVESFCTQFEKTAAEFEKRQ